MAPSPSRTRLRVHARIPQLDLGSFSPSEVAVVQGNPYDDDADTYGVPQQNEAPQQVQSIAFTTTVTAIPTATQALEEMTTTLAATFTASQNRHRTAFYYTSAVSGSVSPSAASFASSSIVSSVASSSLAISSSVALSSVSSSVPPPSSSSLVSSSSTSASPSTHSPSSSPMTSTSAASAASGTPSAGIPPQTMTHGAPFYASVVLGVIIIFACVATAVTFCIRVRARRRADGATTITWEPVVPPHQNYDYGDKTIVMAPECSLTGDRDVGEPKRASATSNGLDRRASLPWECDKPPYPNSFADHTAYYAQPPLEDSAAYPLPPFAPVHINGPYPTVRPLPAHLADSDPAPSVLTRSAASSRNGSVRSRLPSAITLCVANGGSVASSRAGTPLPVPPLLPQYQQQQLRNDAEFEYLGPRYSVPELGFGMGMGTPREVEARPRFMSLPDGRGLDVPWRAPERKATRGSGDEQGQGQEGWTHTLRASVLNAFHGVIGGGGVLSDGEQQEGEEDNLTRAPSMVRRERRESGWRRFAERDVDLEPESDTASVRTGDTILLPPEPGFLRPQTSITGSMASDGNTSVRTDNSQAPLIARPRPAALVSRKSSVYSTLSAVPPVSSYACQGHLRG